MRSSIEDFSSLPKVAKDQKTSIRNKYKRRLRILAATLDDFISHAEMRLDPVRAGRIHKRAEAEELLEHCKALREALPIKDRGDLDEKVFRNLCEVFGMDTAWLDEKPNEPPEGEA